MKAAEITVGGRYIARISGNFVVVRVDGIREFEPVGSRINGRMHMRSSKMYDVTNLKTGRKTSFRSAAKFRREATQQEIEKC